MKLKNMHLVLAIPCFNRMDELLSLKSFGRLDVYLTTLKGELYCLGVSHPLFFVLNSVNFVYKRK